MNWIFEGHKPWTLQIKWLAGPIDVLGIHISGNMTYITRENFDRKLQSWLSSKNIWENGLKDLVCAIIINTMDQMIELLIAHDLLVY